ncbi:DUF1444 family protein [Paraburkholderia hospita]|uniref:DUF1444 family protein n=1 Tax=Paraburkholderia hospita TaxID=169430 RepID=UPI0009A74C55|nr:DUF1444 family protein [Paraburkholderia hospita]SKC69770.1 Uncharacterized protein YtpQ, UPF0354 family [Paraburkholderia hospita]
MGFFDRFRKPPTQEQYAEHFIAMLRSLGDTRQWEYAEQMKCPVLPSAGSNAPSNVINLQNMYPEYLGAQIDERHEVLKRQASGMMQHYVPEDFAQARGRLRPVIRSSTERGVAYLQVAVADGKRNIAFRPLCENLEIGLAYDGEFNIMRLTDAKLAEWNVTFDDAYDIAVDNLRAESAKPFLALKDGVFASQFGDHYDASRLLLTDLLHRQPISGAPVVMVPNRTVLLLTGDRNEAGLQLMLNIAMEERAKPRPLPALMLRWSGEHWERYEPPGLQAKLRELRLQELAADYRDQDALLAERHKRNGLDVFVGQHMVVQSQTGALRSACAWTEGVDRSLLPKTDVVVLFRPSTNKGAFVPLDELLQVCGHLMTQTDHLPARYEARGFPTDEIFQQLNSRFDKL